MVRSVAAGQGVIPALAVLLAHGRETHKAQVIYRVYHSDTGNNGLWGTL